MSELKEEINALDDADATEEGDELDDAIKIPVISEELPESDQMEDNNSEQELPGVGHEPRAKEQNDQSSSSVASSEEEVGLEGAEPSEQVSDPKLAGFDPASQYSSDHYQTLMEKIKTVRDSLRSSVIDSTATGITQGRWDNSYPHLKNACFFLYVFA